MSRALPVVAATCAAALVALTAVATAALALGAGPACQRVEVAGPTGSTGSIVCTLPGGDRVAVAWDTTTPAPGPDGDAGGAA